MLLAAGLRDYCLLCLEFVPGDNIDTLIAMRDALTRWRL
jgi:hypothetical protein